MQSQHNQNIYDRIQEALQQRAENGRLRKLSILDCPIDFRSNDYLGLAQSAWIRQQLTKIPKTPLGATGSRLLSGNTIYHEQIEKYLCNFYNAEAALLYNSGFDANVGLLSTVIRTDDIVFYDEYIHASMHQGIQLSKAKTVAFRHNDINHLKYLIQQSDGERIKWIICESCYSMDGDKAPLIDLSTIAQQSNAHLIVDEAHGIGCFGQNGKGLCDEYDITQQVFARVVTFGKAIGAHGAAVLCTEQMKSYLINFSKPLIYSTSMTPKEVLHIQIAHQYLEKFPFAQHQLAKNTAYFLEQCKDLQQLQGEGPIFSYIIPGEKAVRAFAHELQKKGLAVQPIVSPTVPLGAERLRIILHSFNTKEEIDLLIESLKSI